MDYILEKIFTVPTPPPRVRTNPMKVICLGPSRSGTESLSIALKMLGFQTCHGFDIIYEENVGYIQEWAKLARRKYAGTPDGDVQISIADFDAVLGNSDAVMDIGAYFFAEEIIKAYPDAKVVLNLRRDLDAWHQSAINALVRDIDDRWLTHFLRRLNAEIFWLWLFCQVYGFRPFFRSPNQGSLRHGLVCNGKWVYRDHCNMVRGLVPKERLLEWAVEDGWEPLCNVSGDRTKDNGYLTILLVLGQTMSK